MILALHFSSPSAPWKFKYKRPSWWQKLGLDWHISLQIAGPNTRPHFLPADNDTFVELITKLHYEKENSSDFTQTNDDKYQPFFCLSVLLNKTARQVSCNILHLWLCSHFQTTAFWTSTLIWAWSLFMQKWWVQGRIKLHIFAVFDIRYILRLSNVTADNLIFPTRYKDA